MISPRARANRRLLHNQQIVTATALTRAHAQRIPGDKIDGLEINRLWIIGAAQVMAVT